MIDFTPPRRLNYWYVVLFFLLVLTLRLLGVFNVYFFEEDEVSIAAGVAALVRDNIGDMYRYTVQLGYYRFIEWLVALLGGGAQLIPAVMKYSSAVMGALIPVGLLFLFGHQLSSTARWLAALVAAANPILWKSSQYGSSAMVATGVSLLAICLLSDTKNRALLVLAFLLYGFSITIRADMVLLGPLVIWLTFCRTGSLRKSASYILAFGAVLLACYGMVFIFDSRVDGAFAAVSGHFAQPRETMFWEYLLWSISPIPLLFAVLGLRFLLEKDPRLLVTILIWCLPFIAFYFRSTTTPRYFLTIVAPISILVAVGMIDLKVMLQKRMNMVLVWCGVILASFVHLVVGMGHFQSNWLFSPLFAPTIRTDDGRMPTGALFYDTYLRNGPFFQSYNHPGFGRADHPYWEGPMLVQALEVLGDDQRHKGTIIIGNVGFWHAFHYHAQVVEAEYISRAHSSSAAPFASETWLRIGNNSVMTIGYYSSYYDQLGSFDVELGDEIWFMGGQSFPSTSDITKLPRGYQLVPTSSFHENVQVFQVRKSLKEPLS